MTGVRNPIEGCPYCGSGMAEVGGFAPWVECDECDACGPAKATEGEAIEAWNRVARAMHDTRRVDWLANRDNPIGNVQLPEECVLNHLDDMRAAIDEAMTMPQEWLKADQESRNG